MSIVLQKNPIVVIRFNKYYIKLKNSREQSLKIFLYYCGSNIYHLFYSAWSTEPFRYYVIEIGSKFNPNIINDRVFVPTEDGFVETGPEDIYKMYYNYLFGTR